jgi:hypothetical protein
MAKRAVDREAMRAFFRDLRSSFPNLVATLDLDVAHDYVDMEMRVPAQAGLPFDTTFQLQGDELHISAGAFWLEWFPCTDPEVVKAYHDAVLGLLSGQYRVREHYIGRHAVKAQLQRPTSGGWSTVGTWSNLSALIPWPRHKRILQGRPSGV